MQIRHAALAGALAIAIAPFTLADGDLQWVRLVHLELSITGGTSRTFSYETTLLDGDVGFLSVAETPVLRTPGGWVEVGEEAGLDTVRFAWWGETAAKFANGSGSFSIRVLEAVRVAELLADNATVNYFLGEGDLVVGQVLAVGVHEISWTLSGPAGAYVFGGGVRFETAPAATVPVPAAGLLAALGFGGLGVARARRRP